VSARAGQDAREYRPGDGGTSIAVAGRTEIVDGDGDVNRDVLAGCPTGPHPTLYCFANELNQYEANDNEADTCPEHFRWTEIDGRGPCAKAVIRIWQPIARAEGEVQGNLGGAITRLGRAS
jgi:hypothetical protein